MFYNLLGFLFVFYTIFYLVKVGSTIAVIKKIYFTKETTFDKVFQNSPIKNEWHLLYNSLEIVIFTAVFIYCSIHFFTL